MRFFITFYLFSKKKPRGLDGLLDLLPNGTKIGLWLVADRFMAKGNTDVVTYLQSSIFVLLNWQVVKK